MAKSKTEKAFCCYIIKGGKKKAILKYQTYFITLQA